MIKYSLIPMILILAISLQPLGPSISASQRNRGALAQTIDVSGTSQAVATHHMFLPLVMRPPVPPEFEIIYPADGSTVSGTLYFAAQPILAKTVNSVTFKAGAEELGTDSTAGDGYQAFLDAKQFPAGTLELAATATGPSGVVTKTISVEVLPNPPSSGTVGGKGGVFASDIGSIITIPPGAVPKGTTVSVSEKSQSEVTSENGIDWESLGVTFLGAQQVQSSAQIVKPLGVSSAGFGNRVQPGQAVVNYQIIPDADGDGVDEIVVVNSASVAPNNDVISDPVQQIQVKSISANSGSSGAAIASTEAGINGPPGTTVRIRASGFTPGSLNGNLAVWASSADETRFEIAGLVLPDPTDDSQQVFTTIIPPLPAGGASLTLYNLSTGSASGPYDVTIEAAGPLSVPADQIIADFLADTKAYIEALPTSTPEEAAVISEVVTGYDQLQTDFAELIAGDLTHEEEQALQDIARTISNLEFYSVHEPALTTPEIPLQGGYDWGAPLGEVLAGILGLAVTFISAAKYAGAITVVAGLGWGSLLLIGMLVTLYFYDRIQHRVIQWACQASQSNSGAGTTGMGSALLSGGAGCGNSLLDWFSGASLQNKDEIKLEPGRVTVKVYSSGSSIPFTGLTDAGGYFYIPLIPEGEPFTALAIDNQSGETRSFTGTGPALGEDVMMYFDFISPDDSGAEAIEIGQVVTGEISVAGELDLYSFSAAAGQQVYFDVQVSSGVGSVIWQVSDQTGTTIFHTCLGCGDPGVRTLMRGGTYILSVGEGNDPDTGSYQFQIWDVPAPDEFSISIGDVVSDGDPGTGAGDIETPGVKDIYTFTAAPGQRVYFDREAITGTGSIFWKVVDENSEVVFNDCLGCGDPGVHTLTLGGTYTITVSNEQNDATGTYQFQLWDVPAPDVFSISIGDVVSDGDPGPGAGNIETPGVKDIYTFTAAPGQTVTFDVQATSGTGSIFWKVIDENSEVVFNDCLGCGDPGVHTLTLGGTYTITVSNEQNDATGTYQFQITG